MSINLFQYEYYKRELILVLVCLYTPIGVFLCVNRMIFLYEYFDKVSGEKISPVVISILFCMSESQFFCKLSK